MPNNTTADNDDGNNDSDVDDTNDSNNNDNSGNMSPNDSPSNTTASSEDDEGILDRIESLPVPIIASVGAVILILIIVVVLLIILFCRMKKSSKNGMNWLCVCICVFTYQLLMHSFAHLTINNNKSALFVNIPSYALIDIISYWT